jgi:hypothetical protein
MRCLIFPRSGDRTLRCSQHKILSRFRGDYRRAGRPRGLISSPGRVSNCFFSASTRPTLGPNQPPIQCAPGALSPREKRPEREADHSPPTSAEVKYFLYTPLGTTRNYSAIANLHTLQITTASARPFSSLLCLHQPFSGNGI